MPVAWGILSTARINDVVLRATAGSPQVRWAAVASRDARRAAKYAAALGIARSYGSYDALLEDPEIAAVYVSLPNGLHAEWVERALRASKHVLCEKPLVPDPADLEASAAVARAGGLVLTEAFMWRHHPQTAQALELVAGGAIGRLRHVAAAMSFRLEGDDDPRLEPDLDGGALMDVGCYCVSAARLFAGEPLTAFGEAVASGHGVDVRFLGTLRFPGDVTAQFDVAMDVARRDRLELVGTEGQLILHDPWHCRLPSLELRRPRTLPYGPPPPGDGVTEVAIRRDPADTGVLEDAYRHELEALSAAIAAGEPVRFGVDDALGQARAMAALRRSAGTGALVRLDALAV